MKVSEDKFLNSWKNRQQKGKIRFFLLVGFSWGIIVPVFIGLIDVFQNSFSDVFLNNSFLIKLVVFIFVGAFIMGPIFWNSNNKRYKKLLKKKIDESNS